MEMELTWPPDYNIRRSARARRVSLKICEYRGLEVVLPIGVDERFAHKLLEENKRWVIKKLIETGYHKNEINLNKIPELFKFKCINEEWRIEVDHVESNYVRVFPNSRDKKLLLQGPPDHTEFFQRLLKKWLVQKAKRHLIPMLNEISTEVNLPFNRVTVRAQKTRWGSCSSKKNINLNYKLLFMPPEYVRHIMLHELCHTVHLDHSQQFWSLLQSLDPNCDHHDAETRTFKTDVTKWLDYTRVSA